MGQCEIEHGHEHDAAADTEQACDNACAEPCGDQREQDGE
jgi:hypothetical protein